MKCTPFLNRVGTGSTRADGIFFAGRNLDCAGNFRINVFSSSAAAARYIAFDNNRLSPVKEVVRSFKINPAAERTGRA
ncbi:hypothetical protein Barb7_01365 [Bacteroidales bacterium Barb7]|nr:hypothetical protein Barb7_01365 [Bacteroidales bacterium Barb7]